MYQLNVIKQTKLVKQLGGPPVFHDGFLRRVVIDGDTMVLDIRILASNNPLLTDDTMVALKLKGVTRTVIQAMDIGEHVMIIHDLDIRKEEDGLHMLLEANTGEVSEVWFASIELTSIG